MKTLKCICFLALTLGVVSGAPKRPTNSKKSDSSSNDRISALYVKDGESGDLRFLTGTSNAGTNSAINQFINQKQNLLEQLRPTNNNNGINFGTGTNNFGTGNFGTNNFGTGLGNLGTLGTLGTGSINGISSTNGVTPIIVSLGNGGTTSNTGSTPGVPGSAPIGDLLPQIIAQAVFNSRRGNNNNRRRVANNRRRPVRRGGGNNKPNVFVIRPNQN